MEGAHILDVDGGDAIAALNIGGVAQLDVHFRRSASRTLFPPLVGNAQPPPAILGHYAPFSPPLLDPYEKYCIQMLYGSLQTTHTRSIWRVNSKR